MRSKIFQLKLSSFKGRGDSFRKVCVLELETASNGKVMFENQTSWTDVNSNLTLIGMAYECGFNSKTVFNTYFKKETGLTPKQYVSQL
jgi:AraC-like DNA-binding protein